MSIVFRQWPVVALVALLVPASRVLSPAATIAPLRRTRAGIAAHYGELPIAFEINQGQATPGSGSWRAAPATACS